MTPTVPDADTETRKGEVITAIRQDQDNPAVRAVEGLMATLYGAAHPYGRPQKGTIASVDASSASELRQLHAETFGPGRLSAVIVGDVEAGRAVDVARRVLAGWQAPAPKIVMPPTPSPSAARRRIVVPMMNKAQADIAYGFVSISRSDPGYYALLAVEQRARPIRARRPARRQHPRAPGHGVLRVEHPGRERHPGAAADPCRRQRRPTSIGRSRRSTTSWRSFGQRG